MDSVEASDVVDRLTDALTAKRHMGGKDWLFVVSPNDNGSVMLASIEYLTRLFHRQAAKVDSDL